jgi:putative hemin transport protein
MVFVGNPGVIQIHTGPVRRLAVRDNWFNVLDPGFNLHLREDGVACAWVVIKPTADGPVTALELYDQDGQQLVQFFGKRQPNQHEPDAWRQIVHELPRVED